MHWPAYPVATRVKIDVPIRSSITYTQAHWAKNGGLVAMSALTQSGLHYSRTGRRLDGSVLFTKTSHRVAMARMISVIGVAVGHLAFSLPAAATDVAAWCAVINYGEYWDCQYRSFEECRPIALAKRGWCNPSPYFASSPMEHRRIKKGRGHVQ